jgi:prophage antirepressor-like protein
MKNEVTSYQFDGKTVRTVIIAGEPWFVARDVGGAMSIADVHKTILDFPESEKGRYSIPTLGGTQETTIINEPGLYRLIFLSRKPEAERFKTWVFYEVLPQIRKTGGYQTGRKPTDGEAAAVVNGYIAAMEADYLAAELKAARRVIERYENRNFLSKKDQREILTLRVGQYPISAIQKITKKGRVRIQKFIDEFLALDDEAMEKKLAELGLRRDTGDGGTGGAA